MRTDRDRFLYERIFSKVDAILNTELNKPYEEIDDNLVNECVDFLMEMEGNEEKITKEEIQSNIDAIPFTENKPAKVRRTFRRTLLAAACFAVLLLLLNLAAMAFGVDVASVLKEWRDSIVQLIGGEHLDVGEVTVILPDYCASYKSIGELLKAEELNILYPSNLPGGAVIQTVRCLEYDGRKEVIFGLSDTSLAVDVTLDSPLTDDIITKADSVETVASLVCYITVRADFIQANFVYEGNAYRIQTNERETLMFIIENLRSR